MKLSVFDVSRFSLVQDDKVTSDDLRLVDKKNGNKSMKIFFPIFSMILLIAIIYSIFWEKEFPLFYILVFVFLCFPMSIVMLKEKKTCACYGIVINKTIRCAEVHGRGSVYVPFEKTEADGTYKHKYTLFRTICDFYFCTVEINGVIFENVCCCEKDFSKINIGDRVIIAIEDGYNTPVIYSSGSSCEKK